MTATLTESVKAIVAEAQAAFTVSYDTQSIKTATTKLSELLREWQACDKMVQQTIAGLLDLVRKNCKHEGAQRGYNERDGPWMNPCPTCGYSY